MTKIQNLDYHKKILKNQRNVTKHTPKNVAIVFNLSIV